MRKLTLAIRQIGSDFCLFWNIRLPNKLYVSLPALRRHFHGVKR